MTTPTATRVTIDEFLAMPGEAPYREYFRGEIWEKAMPNQLHGDCVAELITELNLYLRQTGEGRVSTEVRHADRGQDWVYLPDLHVTLTQNRRPSGGGAVEGHPCFARSHWTWPSSSPPSARPTDRPPHS
jgi:Uma2 family endonuclease